MMKTSSFLSVFVLCLAIVPGARELVSPLDAMAADETPEKKAPPVILEGGAWVFDLDASMARCEAIEAHDCAGWSTLDPKALTEARDAYRKGFEPLTRGHAIAKSGQVTINDGDSMNETAAYTLVEEKGEVSLTLTPPTQRPETLMFDVIGKDHLCIVEDSSNSDVICIKRVSLDSIIK